MALLLGASRGFADFLMRHPREVAVLQEVPMPPLGTEDARTVMLAALDEVDVPVVRYLEAAASAIRVRYRRLLAGVAVYDLTRLTAIEAVDSVAAGLADLAGAALDAAIEAARRATARGEGDPPAPAGIPERGRSHALAVIGMGKAGARELNYVSDVDVIFVAESADEGLVTTPRALDIATRLAMVAMRRSSRARHRAAALGGRPQPAARGQGRRPRAHPRLAPPVLRPLGEELGVPGPAEGAARGRPRARRSVRRGRGAQGVGQLGP